MRKLILASAVFGLATSTAAFANPPLVEAELNDTFATANFVPKATYPFGAVAIDGILGVETDGTPNGVDYFAFDFAAGDLITAATYDYHPDGVGGLDTVLGVFRPDGSLFDTDDDDGPFFLSAIHWFADMTGTWRVAVSGFSDFDFNGTGHSEEGPYKLVVGYNPIPEPASLALVAAGLLLGFRRR